MTPRAQVGSLVVLESSGTRSMRNLFRKAPAYVTVPGQARPAADDAPADGMWVRCDNERCRELLYAREFEHNLKVCHKCQHHARQSGRERIAQIAKIAASGSGSFIYCVSLSGVTGARTELPPQLRSFIAKVYGYTKEFKLPVVVGFGLSTPAHIAEVTSYSDGAVVGSALVRLIDQYAQEEQVEAVKSYILSLRQTRGG